MFAVFTFLAIVVSLTDAATISNGELLKLLQENSVSDVQEYLIPNENGNDGKIHDEDDGVIDLQGDPDDEADIETLVDKLGLLDMLQGAVQTSDDPQVGAGCSCSKTSCTCCIGKTISLKVGDKTIRTSLHACVKAGYLPGSTMFMLTFIINEKTVYHRIASLRYPPRVCVKMTGKIIKAYVCLDIYNVNLAAKSMCTRLIGVIDFKVKKVFFRFGIACFKIPKLNGDQLDAPPSAGSLTSDDDVITA